MADQIRYGAGGVPYVGAGGEAPSAPAPEENKEEPQVTVSFEEDDTPLSDEQVQEKATGKSK